MRQVKTSQLGVPLLRLVVPTRVTPPNDAVLVAALAAREEWAARTTWNRYAPMVYGLLDRALGPASDSEDLAQDVFLRVFAAIKTLRDPTALRGFIYSTTVRMLRGHLRSERIRRLLASSALGTVADRTSPSADSEGRELLERFYRLLRTMAADDRIAFTLRRIEELKLEEVAAATGASLATVKRRMRRASKRVAVLAKTDPDLLAYFMRGEALHDA